MEENNEKGPFLRNGWEWLEIHVNSNSVKDTTAVNHRVKCWPFQCSNST